MLSQPVDDPNRRTVLDNPVDEPVFHAGRQLVRESPTADTSQELPHLVEPAIAGDVQSRENLDSPLRTEYGEGIDSRIDLPRDIELIVIVFAEDPSNHRTIFFDFL